MKKLTTIIMALMLVLGAYGIAAAETCTNCAESCETPGSIDRGCEVAQTNCGPFDYDGAVSSSGTRTWDYTPVGYCTEKNETPHFQAFINICDCYEEGLFDSRPGDGDTINVSMEILVDTDGNGVAETGENGVYWAENVKSIGLEIMSKDENLCDPEGTVVKTKFDGPFVMKGANNATISSVNTSEKDCVLDDDEKAVKIIPDSTAEGTGYEIGSDDPVTDFCWYSPNIPALRADTSEVAAGWKVWVRICFTYTSEKEGVCPIDCCTDVYIGSLCCGTDYDIVYPYIPNLDTSPSSGNDWWTGLVITNVTSNIGTCLITLYESDGDVAEWKDISVPANGNFVIDNTSMLAAATKIKGSGSIGDDNGYIIVSPNFPATGYLFIGNKATGQAMGNGYIPVEVPVGFTTDDE